MAGQEILCFAKTKTVRFVQYSELKYEIYGDSI